MDRRGERGEPKVDEEDLEWEYAVSTAGPNAATPWERVLFSDSRPFKCWGTGYYPDGSAHRCFNNEATDIGLCVECYEEMIP